MSYGTSPAGSAQRMITAFFDNRTDADEAVARLHEAGIAQESIRLVPSDGGNTAGLGSASSGQATESFWDALRDLFLPDEDRHTYAEGLRRGGYLVTLHVSDVQYERALDILDDEGTIDIDERAQSWRSEGWTGSSSGSDRDLGTSMTSTTRDRGATGIGAAAASATGVSAGTGLTGSTGTSDTAGMTTAGLSGAGGSTRTTSGRDDEVIPIVEEQLHVGKRDVSHGRVRIRSYVVERPVEEQVSLREEHVQVERRPVDGSARTGAVSGDELFRERTIEMDETREEAVVNKEARVKEELVIRKDVEQRTETISDTVRSTEVDVEDERGNRISDTGNSDPNRR